MKKLFTVLLLFLIVSTCFCAEFIKIPGTKFRMLRSEVTQVMYQTVMKENPSEFKGARLPVENVSWYDAVYFCNKLSEMTSFKPVYSVNDTTDTTKWGYTPGQGNAIEGKITCDQSADGFRLPTVEEWRYAAGNEYIYAGSNDLDDVGWYCINSNGCTHQVEQKAPNRNNLCDMSGNVWEWCWSSDDEDVRWYCGGCYDSFDSYCRVDFKYSCDPKFSSKSIGFRIVSAW